MFDYTVDEGFNVYVDTTSACNARCDFCIANTSGRLEGDTQRFLDGLETALSFTHEVDGTIQVVGGEPLISRRFSLVMSLMKKFTFRRVVVNTNGTRLEERVPQIVEGGVTHVNISRHAISDRENNEVMRFRKEPVTSSDLEAAVAALRNRNIRTRLQGNLINGHLDSLDKIKEYLDFAARIGVDTVSFSELFPLAAFPWYDAPVLRMVGSSSANTRAIVEEIQAMPGIVEYHPYEGRRSAWGDDKPSGWSDDCFPNDGTRRDHARRRFWKDESGSGVIFSIKTLSGWNLDGLPKPAAYDRATDHELQPGVLHFAVVHSDGLVTGSWDRRERALYEPAGIPIVNTRLAA